MALIKDSPEIEVQTIRMLPPHKTSEGLVERIPALYDHQHEALISKESYLRRSAYKNTTIKTDESFFNDSDMKSEYYLAIAYDKKSGTPLLSSRFCFDRTIIAKFLKGDNGQEKELSHLGKTFDLSNYPNGSIFLADRFSGNINNSIYRENRNRLFTLYYAEIANNIKDSALLLMVRKEKYNKQLSKYLNMGFTLLGSTLHKGKEHSIILRDLKDV